MKAHDYQLRAVNFAIENPASYCALDMGLGKTLVSLLWAKQVLKEVPGVLVVAPLRTIYSSWPLEKAKWAPELSHVLLHGPNKDMQLRTKANLYFINYEGLAWLLKELKDIFQKTKVLPFRAIIFDEGSMVKSHSTKRFKIIKTLMDVAAKWRLILSGTPAPNSLQDLWSQYYVLDKGQRLGRTFSAFRSTYFWQADRMGFVWALRPGADEDIWNKIADITYRLDAADYIKIPDKIINEVPVILPPKVMAQYKLLEEDFLLSLEDPIVVEATSAASLGMKLRQFVQGGLYVEGDKIGKERPYSVIHTEKLKVLESLVEEANGQGILCAIQFRFELDMIKTKFPNAPVIAGGVSPAVAGQLISQWNEGKIPLLLCHPGSLSHGVNLQVGSHLIVWYGLTWSLEQYLQFNARLHRQGQLNTVVIHHLVAHKTIDEKVMKALNSKFKGLRELLNFLRDFR